MTVPHAAATRPKRLRLLLGAAIVFIVGGYLVGCAPLPFVQSWWVERETHWDDPLHKAARIADGLLLTNRLSGMSRSQVIGLLGPTPPTDTFSDWDLAYRLGLQRGIIPIDSEWLVIRLDAQGIVREAKIVPD
jgi:hypothetical protein